MRYPRWMDGHGAQGAPRVRKMHNQPGSFPHANPGAHKAEDTAGGTAPPLEVLLPPGHPLSFWLSHPLSHLFLPFVLPFFLALSITFSAILSCSFFSPSLLFSPPFLSLLPVTLSAFPASLPCPCARSILGFEFLIVFFFLLPFFRPQLINDARGITPIYLECVIPKSDWGIV